MQEHSIKPSEYGDLDTFLWRDRKGTRTTMIEMDTRHLFYVVKMIWNHACPKELRIDMRHCYRFGRNYSPEYMLRAFQLGWLELKNRSNLTPYMRSSLQVIEDNFWNYKAYVMKEIT
jgi:hypothetical protein